MSVGVTERRRGPRSDIGAVRMQPRDAQALSWIAEQYGIPRDVLSVLLGRLRGQDRISVGSVRQVEARWQQAGWVTLHRLPGGVWVTLTRAALAMVARPDYFAIEPWIPQVTRLPHVRAVELVRLAFEAADSPGEWISERLIEQDIRKGLHRRGLHKHRPDALIRREGEPVLSIEVELTLKRSDRYRAILNDSDHELSQLWLTWPEQIERLKALLWQAREQARSEYRELPIEVRELPTVAGTYVTAEGEQQAWTLPYEAWRPQR